MLCVCTYYHAQTCLHLPQAPVQKLDIHSAAVIPIVQVNQARTASVTLIAACMATAVKILMRRVLLYTQVSSGHGSHLSPHIGTGPHV